LGFAKFLFAAITECTQIAMKAVQSELLLPPEKSHMD
jgi:hypothetical protein